MELLKINSLPDKKKSCSIQITEELFSIQGDFYYLVNKEFYKAKTTVENCPVKEYLGLSTLCKRSPKKTLRFLLLAIVLEFVDTLAGKIGDIFFFADTSWTSYMVNTAVLLCVIFGIVAFFSKKKVIEISFLSKRFCVDENLFDEKDITKLDNLLLKLR